jgi:integrase
MQLTTKRVARLLKKPGRHPDGHGLYLRVSSPGKASWLLRYERGGRERMVGLGPIHTVGLADARSRARDARLELLDGIDPIDAKRALRAQQALEAARTIVFAAAARQWHKQHEASWKNPKHGRQVIDTLATYAFPVIGALPVGAIDTGLVLKVLEPIWSDKTETASRVRGRIEAVLDWATVRGYRAGENPARWKGHLAEVLPARARIAKPEHHAALPYAEIGAFIAELRRRDAIAARALEFTILTAARTGEVIGAKWGELDLGAKIWTVPAGRMKGGKQHRVPLSDRALQILSELPREDDNDFVFIGGAAGGLSNMAMTAVLKRMGRGDITVHGFRSTFKDWAAELTNYPNHVTEQALGHVIGDKVEKAYRRGDLFDKRRKLMVAWGTYCAKPAGNGATIVPMRKARR